jgi:nucleotide-binding universal stress UspA family protein
LDRLLVAYDGSGSANLALSTAVTVARRDVARRSAPGATDPGTLQDKADAVARIP